MRAAEPPGGPARGGHPAQLLPVGTRPGRLAVAGAIPLTAKLIGRRCRRAPTRLPFAERLTGVGRAVPCASHRVDRVVPGADQRRPRVVGTALSGVDSSYGTAAGRTLVESSRTPEIRSPHGRLLEMDRRWRSHWKTSGPRIRAHVLLEAWFQAVTLPTLPPSSQKGTEAQWFRSSCGRPAPPCRWALPARRRARRQERRRSSAAAPRGG